MANKLNPLQILSLVLCMVGAVPIAPETTLDTSEGGPSSNLALLAGEPSTEDKLALLKAASSRKVAAFNKNLELVAGNEQKAAHVNPEKLTKEAPASSEKADKDAAAAPVDPDLAKVQKSRSEIDSLRERLMKTSTQADETTKAADTPPADDRPADKPADMPAGKPEDKQSVIQPAKVAEPKASASDLASGSNEWHNSPAVALKDQVVGALGKENLDKVKDVAVSVSDGVNIAKSQVMDTLKEGYSKLQKQMKNTNEEQQDKTKIVDQMKMDRKMGSSSGLLSPQSNMTTNGTKKWRPQYGPKEYGEQPHTFLIAEHFEGSRSLQVDSAEGFMSERWVRINPDGPTEDDIFIEKIEGGKMMHTKTPVRYDYPPTVTVLQHPVSFKAPTNWTDNRETLFSQVSGATGGFTAAIFGYIGSFFAQFLQSPDQWSTSGTIILLGGSAAIVGSAFKAYSAKVGAPPRGRFDVYEKIY